MPSTGRARGHPARPIAPNTASWDCGTRWPGGSASQRLRRRRSDGADRQVASWRSGSAKRRWRWRAGRYRKPGSSGRCPGGARNVNILVDDAGGSRYVLCCCRRNPSRDRIRFQLDFQDHLRCRGIPTAEVVVTETGDRYVVTDAASLWVLFRFVQGNAYRYGNRAQLENAARCLSDIHGAAADFTAAPVEDDTIPDLRRWWNTLTRDL